MVWYCIGIESVGIIVDYKISYLPYRTLATSPIAARGILEERNQSTMSSGANAADKVKGMFKGGSVSVDRLSSGLTSLLIAMKEASESLRQNINSFADEMAAGSKTDTADTREGGNAYTTGTTSMAGTHSSNGATHATSGGPLASEHKSDGSRTLTGGSESEMGRSGFNRDVEKVGEGIRKGVEGLRK